MQPRSQQISTCPNCGGVLEETSGGELECVSCLLRAGIDSDEEMAQDSTPDALDGSVRFGIYEIDRREDGSLYELGRGSMGVTYRATDTSLQRKVALKLIKTDIAERSADARERFMREARAAAAVRHENIATVHQFGMRLETGQYFYAMELIEGETLEQRVRRAGPLDSRTTIGIAEQVTSALAAAEKHGLVHRDLKPANLMLVSPGGETSNNQKLLVKIIDFGLAKAIHTATDPKSLTNDRFVGTPAFASPEQFEHSALDVRSDIYSLGETLWFALTGKTPFSGRTMEEVHRAQKSNVLPLEQLKGAHVPHRLKSLLESMLAFDPASRPGTSELAARLQLCSPEVRSVRRTRFTLAASLITLAAAAGWIVWKTEFIRHPLPKSIAVLPLLNKSDDPNDEYFSDGLSEELIAALVQIKELKVIGRSSSFRFKDRKEDSKTIGKKLGVSTLLDGTVRKQGDRVHIVADMVNAADGIELWTRTFDRDLKDTHAVEQEIARAVAESLKVTLLGSDSAQKSAPENVDAHNAYLLGHFHFQRRNLEDYRKAVTYFDEAIRLNPDYALAYAERSEAWFFIGDMSSKEKKEAWAAAVSDAERAVAIDPALAEAYAALGWVRFLVEWKFAEGLSALERAKELSPRNPTANHLLARIIVCLGRFEEAERLAREAVELDPLSVRAQNNLACVLFFAGKFDEADAIERKTTELQPTAAGNRHWQVLAAVQRGDGETALRLAHMEPDEANRRFELAIAQYVRGDHKAADAALADLIANDRDESAYQIALVYVVRGEKNKAFEWLQVSFDNHDAGTLGLFADPLWRGLRADPRYKNLLAKLGLPGAS
jgi:serine/threonine-protein kinase